MRNYVKETILHPSDVIGNKLQAHQIPVFAKWEERLRLRLHIHHNQHQFKIERIQRLGFPNSECGRGHGHW